MESLPNNGLKSKENLFPIRRLIEENKYKAMERSKALPEQKEDHKLREEFNINDNFAVKKSEFQTLLPKLMETMSEHSPNRQSIAIRLLHSILLHDWKLQDCKLTISALKKQLIPKLISIFEKTNETEVKQTINNLYLFLFFVIGFDNKEVQTLLLMSDNLFINSTISHLNSSNDEITQINDFLLLLQFYIYYSKAFDTIFPILSTLIRFIEHNDNSVVSQSCYTLMIFSQSFAESRKAILVSEQNVCKVLIDLWAKTDDNEIIKPIFGVITSILPRFNQYKNKFLGKNIDILAIIPKLVKSSSDLNKIYASNVVKYIAMKPINVAHDSSLEQIKTMIDRKTIGFINDLLEYDQSFEVKSSALMAIFVVAYNVTYPELKQLAEQGCLKALCSQLDSDDAQHLRLTLLALAVFLFEEYKYTLKEKKYLPDPKTELSEFATIIKEFKAIERMKRIDTEIVEEILVWAYGVETRPERRRPSIDMMSHKNALITCIECPAHTLANTKVFDCGHVQLCQDCASSALHKVYVADPRKCKFEKCTGEIPTDSAPWYWFKMVLYKTNIQQTNELNHKLNPNFIHMKTKRN